MLMCWGSEVSYAQGMNDLCSRFLEVLDSEVDTYWSFSCYMEKFSKDFRADGLHRKIGLLLVLIGVFLSSLYMCNNMVDLIIR